MKNKSKLVRAVIAVGIVCCLLLLLGVGSVYYLLQPVTPGNKKTQTLVIAKGTSVKAIGTKLQAAGLIKNASLFAWLVRYQNLSNKIQAGTFQLSADMTASQIATHLTQGTSDVWITLLEGWRSEEVAQALTNLNELSDFDPKKFNNLAQLQAGRIFPDTYLIPKAITSQALIELFTTTFDKKVQTQAPEFLNLSPEEQKKILILASLLEREAQGKQDMTHVAGILNNRLDAGMPLQVDATLQFAKGYSSELGSWWVPPSAVDKQRPSIYNTYLNPGLPPNPICNPGITAIQAALNPDATQDLYYLHDRQGQIHYARTLQQHNQNVTQYLRGE